MSSSGSATSDEKSKIEVCERKINGFKRDIDLLIVGINSEEKSLKTLKGRRNGKYYEYRIVRKRFNCICS